MWRKRLLTGKSCHWARPGGGGPPDETAHLPGRTRRCKPFRVIAGLLLLLALLAASACGHSAETATGPAGSRQQASGREQVAPSRRAELDQVYQEGLDALGRKSYQEAVAATDRVLREDPGHYPAWTVKGIALCYAGDFQTGMQCLDRALSLKPDYSYACFNKALAYELYGCYDQALHWYRETIRLEKNSVWSYYGIASIYGRRGDVPNAVSYLKQAIRLNPAAKEAARMEKDFDKVKNSPEFQELLR